MPVWLAAASAVLANVWGLGKVADRVSARTREPKIGRRAIDCVEGH